MSEKPRKLDPLAKLFKQPRTICWQGYRTTYQGCSEVGTRGKGVPTPFSRFALKWV